MDRMRITGQKKKCSPKLDKQRYSCALLYYIITVPAVIKTTRRRSIIGHGLLWVAPTATGACAFKPSDELRSRLAAHTFIQALSLWLSSQGLVLIHTPEDAEIPHAFWTLYIWSKTTQEQRTNANLLDLDQLSVWTCSFSCLPWQRFGWS